jgi:hypothetical protein
MPEHPELTVEEEANASYEGFRLIKAFREYFRNGYVSMSHSVTNRGTISIRFQFNFKMPDMRHGIFYNKKYAPELLQDLNEYDNYVLIEAKQIASEVGRYILIKEHYNG